MKFHQNLTCPDVRHYWGTSWPLLIEEDMNLCHGSFFDQDFRSWAWTDSLFSRRLSSFLFYANIEVKNDGIEVWKEESGEFLGVSCFCGSDSDCMDKLDNYRYGRALFVFSMSPLNKNWKLKELRLSETWFLFSIDLYNKWKNWHTVYIHISKFK